MSPPTEAPHARVASPLNPEIRDIRRKGKELSGGQPGESCVAGRERTADRRERRGFLFRGAVRGRGVRVQGILNHSSFKPGISWKSLALAVSNVNLRCTAWAASHRA